MSPTGTAPFHNDHNYRKRQLTQCDNGYENICTIPNTIMQNLSFLPSHGSRTNREYPSRKECSMCQNNELLQKKQTDHAIIISTYTCNTKQAKWHIAYLNQTHNL